MANYEDFVLYDGLTEDIEKVKKLPFGSDEWKKVQDSIDKRYNTTLSEARLGEEISDKEARIGLEKMKIEKEAEDREARLELERMKVDKEAEEREARLRLEKQKAEKDAELRELEAEVAEKKSKREFIGKLAGIFAGIIVIFGKIAYDNSEAITDKFTLDAGSKMINNK